MAGAPILVVDPADSDAPDVRALRQSGIRVLDISFEEKTLEFCTPELPSHIVLAGPLQPALDFVQAIKAHEPLVEIVLAIPFSEQALVPKALHAGVDDVVPRPLVRRQLSHLQERRPSESEGSRQPILS